MMGTQMKPPDLIDEKRRFLFQGIPAPPGSLIVQGGSLEVLLTWNAPEDLRGVDRFYVFVGTENDLVWQSHDRSCRQVRLKVPADTNTAFYVSCVSKAGRESSKVQAIGKAGTDKYVTTGTTGETSGTQASTPPGWMDERTGGAFRKTGVPL
jgi:hypothetical protein